MIGSTYRGLLCVGDPHLASRVPGFRKDDYPRTILGKLEWAMEYARSRELLPVILGDMFHWPRDNANWLLGELFGVLRGDALIVAGNHDCRENVLQEDDSLMVLVRGGAVRLLSQEAPWSGTINGRAVRVGGTSWGRPLPKRLDRPAGDPLVFWITHHSIGFVGPDPGRIRPKEIDGIDVVINGHIHHSLEDVIAGRTTWINPGGITRVTRGDASRQRVPAAWRLDVSKDGWSRERVEIPHRPFDEVFYEDVLEAAPELSESLFVRGLAELEARRTQDGTGLKVFLERNLGQFEEEVAREVMQLAQEACPDEFGE